MSSNEFNKEKLEKNIGKLSDASEVFCEKIRICAKLAISFRNSTDSRFDYTDDLNRLYEKRLTPKETGFSDFNKALKECIDLPDKDGAMRNFKLWKIYLEKDIDVEELGKWTKRLVSKFDDFDENRLGGIKRQVDSLDAAIDAVTTPLDTNVSNITHIENLESLKEAKQNFIKYIDDYCKMELQKARNEKKRAYSEVWELMHSVKESLNLSAENDKQKCDKWKSLLESITALRKWFSKLFGWRLFLGDGFNSMPKKFRDKFEEISDDLEESEKKVKQVYELLKKNTKGMYDI